MKNLKTISMFGVDSLGTTYTILLVY